MVNNKKFLSVAFISSILSLRAEGLSKSKDKKCHGQ